MKKTAGAIDTLQRTTHRGGGCGCFATGCGIVALLFMTMCVGSYIVTMHSSIPLALIKAALEEDGNVQVEGLRGSISSGFEIDTLRFQSEEEFEEWNELRDIKFTYNGFVNLLRTRRILIEEASIGSATIYANIDGDEDDASFDFDAEAFAREFAKEWSELQDELQKNSSNDLKELRIDLISAQDIVVIDPRTEKRLEFQKAEFRGYHMLDGRIRNIGNLQVVSDQIDLKTSKSLRFPEERFARAIAGTLKPAAYPNIIRDLPFELDFAMIDGQDFQLHAVLCDGQVVIDEPQGNQRQIRLQDFSHGQYFKMSSPLVPAHWNVQLTIETEEYEVAVAASPESEVRDQDDLSENVLPDEELPAVEGSSSAEQASSPARESKPPAPTQPRPPRKRTRHKHTLVIEPGSSFVVGETTFQIETTRAVLGPEKDQREPPVIVAVGELGEQRVQARLRLRQTAPWYAIELQAEGIDSRDVWSRLCFDRDYEALDADQQAQVDQAVHPAAKSWPEQEDPVPVDF